MSRTALLCIDYINEIVHADGKLSGKGYGAFVEKHDTLASVAKLQEKFRAKDALVVHVKVGFSRDYIEQNKNSPLTGKAHEFGALVLGEWGTDFHDAVLPKKDEPVIAKHRVNSFYGTKLDLLLRTAGVDHVVIAGVATDMAAEATARDAHDRDYKVTVISDCCASANEEDQQSSLKAIGKLSTVTTQAEFEL